MWFYVCSNGWKKQVKMESPSCVNSHSGVQVWRIMTINVEGGIIINYPKSVEYKKTKGLHLNSVTSC